MWWHRSASKPMIETDIKPVVTWELESQPGRLQFSPDGRLLYAQDGQFIYTLHIPEFRESRPLRIAPKERGRCHFLHGGRSIMLLRGGCGTAHDMHHVAVRDLPTNSLQTVADIRLELDGALLAINFNRREDEMIIRDSRGTFHFLEFPSCQLKRSIKMKCVSGVLYSPDESEIWSIGVDNAGDYLIAWDPATGKSLRRARPHNENSYSALRLTPDAKHLVLAGEKALAVLDTKNWTLLGVFDIPSDWGISQPALAFSPRCPHLAFSWDSEARIFMIDWQKRELLYTLPDPSDSQVAFLAYSPDGKFLASSSWDRDVRLWEMPESPSRSTSNAPATGMTVYPESLRILSSASSLAPTAGNLSKPLVLSGHDGWVFSVAWKPDAKALATGADDKTIRFWNSEDGSPMGVLHGHESRVDSVAWHPAGKIVASSSQDNTVRLWDVVNLKQLCTLVGHTEWVQSVAWSLDGNVLASGGWDAIRLWDAVTAKPLRILTDSGFVHYVVWKPDGSSLASANMDGSVCLWDPVVGKKIAVLAGHEDQVNCVGWSPDGKTLVSGSIDMTIRFWDPETGKQIEVLNEYASSVAWSPDGRFLATSSTGARRIHLWDPQSGKELCSLKGHAEHIWSIAWSSDSKRLASTSFDKTVRIWNMAEELGRTIA
jgi:WD40 repeat protein